MGGLPASPSKVLRTMAGVGGPKHLGGSATLRVGNRVAIHSVSMVLRLGILVDTLYLARFLVALGGSDKLLVSL